MKVDLCIEGSGVKGIAFAGALSVLEKNNYESNHIVGASAGAIVAALLAAGYSASTLKTILTSTNFSDFENKENADRDHLSKMYIYDGALFQDWITRLLLESPRGPIVTFADLKTDNDDPRWKYRLQVVATDISQNKSIVFPRDAKDYGINPDELNVAMAVRMSISTPFFFEPVLLQGKYIIVGGILGSSFLVWLFDSSNVPAWPTFGLRLIEPGESTSNKINRPLSMTCALLKIIWSAHDTDCMENAHFARTIAIPTGNISSTDFDLTEGQVKFLYESGRDATVEFLEEWDFEGYKKLYRS